MSKKMWAEKSIFERMSERPDTIIALGIGVECCLILFGHLLGGW